MPASLLLGVMSAPAATTAQQRQFVLFAGHRSPVLISTATSGGATSRWQVINGVCVNLKA